MTYDPNRHHRRSIRLKGYDYTQAGAYYVTIVCQDRACLFGEIVDGEMQVFDSSSQSPATESDLAFISWPSICLIFVYTVSAASGDPS